LLIVTRSLAQYIRQATYQWLEWIRLCVHPLYLIHRVSNLLVLIDPGTYIFYNATMSRNHDPAKNHPGEYSTDLISAAAVGFLDDAIKASDRPFFLGVAPIAPHSETIVGSGPARFNAPVPAKRHEHLFANVTVPRTPNFNPNTVGHTPIYLTATLTMIPRPAQHPTSKPSANSTKPRSTTTTTGTASGSNPSNPSTS
jgi:hypothetical protein